MGVIGNIDVIFYIKINSNVFICIKCFICVFGYIIIFIRISEVKSFIIIINSSVSNV